MHGELTRAVQSLDPSASRLRGVSRTDAGVHARDQKVAFDPSRTIPCKGWVLGVNSALPPDLAVRHAREVAPGFDPRAHSRGKRYRYELRIDRVRDPLRDGRAWRIDPPFDLARAREEAAATIGTHDFCAFRTSSDARTDTTRSLTRVELIEREDHVSVVVEGTAFLHNMIRILVGTVVDVGRGRLRSGAVARGLASRDRSDLGMTAPAHGLLLDEVFLDLSSGHETGDGGSEGSAWP